MLVNVKQKKIKREVVVEKLDGAKAPLVSKRLGCGQVSGPELLTLWLDSGGETRAGEEAGPQASQIERRSAADVHRWHRNRGTACRTFAPIKSTRSRRCGNSTRVVTSGAEGLEQGRLQQLRQCVAGDAEGKRCMARFSMRVLFGLLAAGIISAVMGSGLPPDSGPEHDVHERRLHLLRRRRKMGEKSVVHMGRASSSSSTPSRT